MTILAAFTNFNYGKTSQEPLKRIKGAQLNNTTFILTDDHGYD